MRSPLDERRRKPDAGPSAAPDDERVRPLRPIRVVHVATASLKPGDLYRYRGGVRMVRGKRLDDDGSVTILHDNDRQRFPDRSTVVQLILAQPWTPTSTT